MLLNETSMQSLIDLLLLASRRHSRIALVAQLAAAHSRRRLLRLARPAATHVACRRHRASSLHMRNALSFFRGLLGFLCAFALLRARLAVFVSVVRCCVSPCLVSTCLVSVGFLSRACIQDISAIKVTITFGTYKL